MSNEDGISLPDGVTLSENGTIADGVLRLLVKESVLSGNESLSAILTHIGDSDGKNANAVKRLLSDGMFLRELEQARLNIEDTVIKWFKRRALTYAKQMDKLAKHDDPRVAFQANKDALDRIGTKPEQKVAVSGIDQYRALIVELTGEDDAEPNETV